MATNNGGSCSRRRHFKFMECGLNQFPNSSVISSNNKSKAMGAVESSGTCACHRSFLKRQKVFQPDALFEPLSRPAVVASATTASRFSILPSTPQPPPWPATLPQTAPLPPPLPSPVISESSISWEEMEKNKPLKKRKVKLIRETSTLPSE